MGILPAIDLLKRLQEMLQVEHLHGDQDVVRLVEDRLPIKALEALRTAGVTDDEIYSLILPRRTLSHRIARREPLTIDESDRVVRILRVAVLGEGIFGERERLWRWLRAPKRQFDGRSPLSLLTTDAGSRVVEEMLVAIDEGFAA